MKWVREMVQEWVNFPETPQDGFSVAAAAGHGKILKRQRRVKCSPLEGLGCVLDGLEVFLQFTVI